MIRMNVSEETLEKGQNLIGIVKSIINYQVFYKGEIGKELKLKEIQSKMYESEYKKSFIYKKIKFDYEHNLVKPLCDTATSTFLGRVPDIVSNGNDKEKERISKFSLIQKHNDFEEEIYDVALKCSITGSGFLCLYNEEGDTFPKYRSLDPLYTNVVYDMTVSMKRLFAYNIYFEPSSSGNGIMGHYVCIIYTRSKMFAFQTSDMSMSAKDTFQVYPLQLFLINGVEMSFEQEHGFDDIPVVEFFNNKKCISDCKPALPQIALYGGLQNNRFQNVDDLMNYLLFIKNARLGNDKEAEEAVELIKRHRVLALEGEDVDARFLSNPLNQTDIQKLADDFKNEIHYITHIPDFTSVDFTQNASDPILKAKTKPLLDLCMEKEKWFNKGYMQVLDLTLKFVERYGKDLYSKIKFDLEDVDLVYTHSLPSNDIDTINAIVNLSNAGLCNPRVLLQGVSMIPNVDNYLKGMEEYNEYVDKRKQNNQNNNGKLNETNLERQNKEPITRKQMDNKINFVNGQSQKLSDDKVE